MKLMASTGSTWVRNSIQGSHLAAGFQSQPSWTVVRTAGLCGALAFVSQWISLFLKFSQAGTGCDSIIGRSADPQRNFSVLVALCVLKASSSSVTMSSWTANLPGRQQPDSYTQSTPSAPLPMQGSVPSGSEI